MKQIKILLGLILLASVSTFAQSPRIKLNQITKDSVTGSVLISSPTDSGMVYSRDLFISYGADTVLILYGDTISGGGGLSSVLSDGVTVLGNGTTGNELRLDTFLIATVKALNDTLTARGYLTGNQTITLSGDVNGSGTTAITATVVDDSHNHIISNVDNLQDSLSAKANASELTNYVTTNTAQTISGAKTITSDLDVDGKIALNAGDNNIVIGDGAGASLVSGQALNNILIGPDAGAAIDSGDYNFASGFRALYLNTTGSRNLASGYQALYSNTTGDRNVASGFLALLNLSSGSNNQAYGFNAGRYYGSSTDALTTANSSLFIGSNSRASADNNSNEIVIGTDAIGNGSNSITLGASSNSKVVLNGVGTTGGTNSALYITSGGELTTNSSDERLKTNINSLDSELNTLLNLNPVRYNYYDDLENEAIGFIAQELEIYYPNLVFTNPISNYKGVHYHLFAPILVKAIQEQQTEIDQLKTLITDLTNRLTILENK